ncbi:MAG: type II secretion system protein GspJ [Phycisphaerales bacterium]
MSQRLRHAKPRSVARHRAGFTLVEALAATVLLALLAAAIAGLSVGWMHAERAIGTDAGRGALERALDALADDLSEPAPGWLDLTGLPSEPLEFITANRIPSGDGHTATGWQRVRWSIDPDGDQLVRTSQPVDGPVGAPPSERTVVTGVAALTMQHMDPVTWATTVGQTRSGQTDPQAQLPRYILIELIALDGSSARLPVRLPKRLAATSDALP